MVKRKYNGGNNGRNNKRRRYNRRPLLYRNIRPLKNFLKVKRSWTESIVIGAAGITYYSRKFKISDLPNYTEFTTLFDSYKIAGVGIKFIPIANSATVSAQGLPVMYSYWDMNDATAPSTVDSMLEKPNCKVRRLSVPFKTFARPMIADAVYQGAFTGYGQNRQWISSNSVDVEHYGFKFALDLVNTTAFRVVYTYYIMCKDPR